VARPQLTSSATISQAKMLRFIALLFLSSLGKRDGVNPIHPGPLEVDGESAIRSLCFDPVQRILQGVDCQRRLSALRDHQVVKPREELYGKCSKRSSPARRDWWNLGPLAHGRPGAGRVRLGRTHRSLKVWLGDGEGHRPKLILYMTNIVRKRCRSLFVAYADGRAEHKSK
jgi:hypothetical protein